MGTIVRINTLLLRECGFADRGAAEAGAYAAGRGRPGVANIMPVIDLMLRLP